MKYLTCLLYFLLLSGQADAQRQNAATKLQVAIDSMNKGNTDTAEVLFNQVIVEASKSNNFDLIARAKMNVGRIYADKGRNVIALGLYQEALTQAESVQNRKLQAAILKHIGALYISWKKFNEALTYYNKAEQLAVAVGDEELIADCQNNKGTVYEQQKKFDEAIKVYKNALDIYTRKNITAKISMALSNVAIVYKFQKNYQESLKYNFKAISLSEKTGDEWMMAATYNNIGNLYGEIGDYKNAILYCERALSIAKKIDALEIVESIYDSMAEAAAKAGDYKNAYAYRKQFSAAMDQFINIENAKQLSELNVKYETEKKHKIIQQQQFEITKRNYWLLVATLIFILVLLALYFSYRVYRHKQEQKLQQEVFRQKEVSAKALFEGEQNERIRIARDLHDGLGQMLSLVKMNLSSVEKPVPSLEQSMKLVDQTIDELRRISHNLIPEALNFGIFQALEDLAEKINASGSTHMEIDIEQGLIERKFEMLKELSIYRVVQEIVNNMIKHARASQIHLTIGTNDIGIVLRISDNGCGLDEDAIGRSKGIGWNNIHTRVHLLDGKIKIHSEKLSGTQIEIFLPL
ncbi:sensor histidine kinase [Pedobacter foliorum]|uniref:tetratricopeptide repeat-containing sensor histidine kinase n=1 Tax=Pedobacter foliorum TaxID=2739058 RepID=UPI0015658287|nr:sensor histidine kinase [Pedobacter foliorum]NRF40881.1 sensor histidine kinase [Pedobacter foliorum]